MSSILEVIHKHADESVIFHALYGYYFLGIPKIQLSKIYHKSPSTITNWIQKFEEDGHVSRKQNEEILRKFSPEMRQWLVDLYKKQPLLYLDESRDLFEKKFEISISISSIWSILHNAGFTHKTIERHAIQISYSNIERFLLELSALPWNYSHLLFLDEVSFDNRCMLRNRGYAIRGEKLIHRGEFVRKPRESLLCFLSETGMVESYWTEGTFTRQNFFKYVRDMATSGKIQQYPGRLSIWVMDGARIHCDASIIYYLR